MKWLALGLSLVAAHGPDEVYRRNAQTMWPPYPDVELTTGSVEYKVGDKTFEGYYAYPASTTPLPGIIVAHQWLGLGDMEKFRAREMASRGFVALATDTYGKGIQADEARNLLGWLRANPDEYTARILAGLDTLKTLPQLVPGATPVNTSQLFGIGYCAGGGYVFELARHNPDGLLGVAGFHPSLAPLHNGSKYPATTRVAIQAHHASLDNAGDAGLLAFEAEMKSRNVSIWSTHKYGNCQHGWTDPTSTIYRAVQAEEAHATMRQFFGQLIGRTPDICGESNAPASTSGGSSATVLRNPKGKLPKGKKGQMKNLSTRLGQ